MCIYTLLGKRFSTLFLVFILLFASAANAQISVTATAGTTSGTYTTLYAAATAINAGIHQGVINIAVTASTTESAQVVFNMSGTGSSSYSAITIKPAASTTPTISGSIDNLPLIKLMGNNIVVDGANTVGGVTRDLTVTNTSVTYPETIDILSSGTTPVHDVTIKNTQIVNGSSSSTALVISDGATTGNPGYFYNITVQNSSIKKAYIGIYAIATVLTGNGNGLNISGNDINGTGVNSVDIVGIYVQGVDGTGGIISNNNIGNFVSTTVNSKTGIWLATSTSNFTLSGNNISGITSPAGASYSRGIFVSSGLANANVNISGNTISSMFSSGTGATTGICVGSAATGGVTIQNNKISTIRNTSTTGWGSNGIQLSSTLSSANINVYNNFISDVASYGYSLTVGLNDNGYGIALSSGGGYKIYHNSVSLGTNQTTGVSAAININGVTTASSVDLRDNIFANTQTTNTRYAIYCANSNTIFSSINYNDYYAPTNLGYIGSNRNTIAAIQTGFGGNLNSITYNPAFVSYISNLHLTTVAANNVLAAGTPIASPAITTDIDGDARSTTTPTMGGDELNNNTIAYTALPTTTCSAGDVILSGVSITSAGVPTTGTTVPQIYFRKNSGTWFHASGSLTSGTATTGVWSFTISAATLGGVTAADVITYYVVAQTTGGIVFANPSTGLVAADVNTVTTAPTTPNSYTVLSVPTSVTATASSTALCVGNTLTLTGAATGATSYSWTGPNSFTSAVLNPAGIVTSVASSGIYTLVATNSCGSTTVTTSSVTVTAAPSGVAATASATTLCSGDALTLTGTATGGTSYSWSGPGGYSAIVLNPPAITTTTSSAGIYSLTATNSCGSALATTTAVTVNTIPTSVSAAASATTICLGSPLTLTGLATGATSYSWSGPGGYTAAVLNPPAITTTLSSAGIYTLTALNACGTATATAAAVTIVTVPTAVTANASATTLCSGDALTLTGAATGGTSYSWSGPAGYADVGLSPTAIITTTSSAGIYTFTATNACGNTVAYTSSVTINTTPTAVTATANPTTLCSGATLTLTGTSTSPITTTYSWSGPGSYTAAVLNPSAITTTTSSAGIYVLTATNACGNTTASTASVTINTVPTAVTATANPTTLCSGDALTLTGTATSPITTSYSWAGPDSYTSTDLDPAAIVTSTLSAGIYTLTATNICGSTTATTGAVTVNTIPLGVTAMASDTSLCGGNTLTLTGTATSPVAATYSWSGPGGYTSAVLNPAGIVVATASTGIYSLTATNVCGSAMATTAMVTVHTTPTGVTATAAPTPLCSGDALTLTGTSTSPITTTYSWSGPDSYSSTDLNPAAITTTTLSAGVYILTATNSCGNTSASTASVIVRQVPQGVTATASPTTLCAGSLLTVNGTATGGTTYSWSGPGGYTSANLHPVAFTTTTSSGGIYTLTATNICGSTTATTPSVTINTVPTAVTATASPTLLCLGNTLTLTGAATSPIATTYSWAGPGGYSAAVLNPSAITATAGSAGIYTLTATNTCGNTQAFTGAVTVITVPTGVTATSVVGTLCIGTTLTLTGTAAGATSYQWTGPGGYSSFVLNPAGMTTTPLSVGIYTLTATNTCGSTIATTGVSIFPYPAVGAIIGADTLCEGSIIGLSDTVTTGVWSSSNTSVATINSTGNVLGVTAGTAIISYNVSNGCGTALASLFVTVLPVPIASPISGDTLICLSHSALFTDAVPGGMWTTSNAAIATVGTTGLVTGLGTGAVTISYTVANSCGSAVSNIFNSVVGTLPDAGTIGGPIRVCQTDTIRLNSDVAGGIWLLTNGRASITGNLITGISTGLDTAMYIVFNSCGSDTSRFVFYVRTVAECASGVNNVTTNDINCIVYPNPNDGLFSIAGAWNANEADAIVEVVNILGQVVYSSKLAITNGTINERIQLGSSIPSGIYILNINSANAHKTIRFTVGRQ